MQLLKQYKNILIYLLLISFSTYGNVFPEKCLNSEFEESLEHKVGFLNLFESITKVSKNKCVIEVYNKEYFVFKNYYKIDVCRLPIHLKYGKGHHEIFEKQDCSKESQKDQNFGYCDIVKKIKQVMMRNVLIYAQGEKSNLEDQHGRVFCAYELMTKYLLESAVFDRRKKNVEESKELKEELNLEEEKLEEIKNVVEEKNLSIGKEIVEEKPKITDEEGEIKDENKREEPIKIKKAPLSEESPKIIEI